MKKALFTVALVLTTSIAQARLSGECTQSLQEVAAGYSHTQATTETNAALLTSMWQRAARSVVLLCVGLEQINMEKSLRGKMGLISEDEIIRRSVATQTEAENYLNSLIQQ